MTDQGKKKTERQKILDRLNSNDTGPGDGQDKSKERLKEETERQKALEKGRRGMGWIGGM